MSNFGGVYDADGFRYAETIDLLYTTFAFQVDHPAAVYEFFTTVPMVRLNMIRKLQIIWSWRLPKYMMNPPRQTVLGWTVRKLQGREKQWLRCCKIMKNMQGLQDLRIRLFKDVGNDLNEWRLLKPLIGIKVQGNNCVLELPAVEGWKEGDRLVGMRIGEKSLQFPIERREVLGDNNWRSVRGIVGVGSFGQAKLYVQIPAHIVALILVPPVVAVYLVKKTIIKFDQSLEQGRKQKARMTISGKK
jgi:hypothetical protein